MTSTNIADFIALSRQKSQLETRIRALDHAMGRAAAKAIEHDGATRSSLAREVGLSHTAVRNLIDSTHAQSNHSDEALIPLIKNSRAGDYVRDRDATVVRVVAGFANSDVLAASGLNPLAFADDNDRMLYVPHMLWQLSDGQWIGIDDVSIGYGGAGPGWAHSALTSAGISEEDAHRICAARYCDADLRSPAETWTLSTRWPFHPLCIPRLLEGQLVIAHGDAIVERVRHNRHSYDIDQDNASGFYPSPQRISPWQAWIDLMTSDTPPEWLRGQRVARVFLTSEEAARQGFIVPMSHGFGFSYPLAVVQQGPLQLWLHEYRAEGRMFPDKVYDFLDQVDIDYGDLRRLDEQRATARDWIARALFHRDEALPPMLDLPGGSDLQVVPPHNPDNQHPQEHVPPAAD